MSELTPSARLACLAFAVVTASCKPDPLPGEGPVGAIVATQPATEQEEPAVDPVLIRVGEQDVRLHEFERAASRLAAVSQRKLNTAQGRSELLQMFVLLELLSQHAAEVGLSGDAEEALLVEEARARAWLDQHAAGTVGRDQVDEDLEHYYRERIDDFVGPEQRRIYGIVVETEEEAVHVRDEVVRALEHVRASQAFDRLAGYYSVDDATRGNGGSYGWLVSNADGGNNDAALDAAVFALDDTGVGPPVHTSRGWEVFMVAEIREARNLTLEDVRGYLSDEAFLRASGADQREQIDAARAELGAVVDRSAVERLAAARADEPDSSVRPRRYSLSALAQEPGAELGDAVVDAIEAAEYELRHNPATAPAQAGAPEPAPTGASENPEQ